jgi:hypothetical protein
MRFMTMVTCVLMTAAAAAQTAAPAPASAALYANGMSWDQYLASTKVQRETWVKNAGREVPAGMVDRMKRAGEGLRLLVVTADWCTDSVHSVPYLARLATLAGVDLRVVGFREGKPVMEAHRTPDGRASTPTVILLRGDREVAAWVERPAALQWWALGAAGQINDAERKERTTAWYQWNRGADALAEIVALAEQSMEKP